MMRDNHGSHGTEHAAGDPAHLHASGRVHGQAVSERDVASGTIKSIGGTSFVLATKDGDVTVITRDDTNFHGLSRRRAREAGYEDPTAVNTFAALRVGRHVGAMGERQADGTLLAERVHVSEP